MFPRDLFTVVLPMQYFARDIHTHTQNNNSLSQHFSNPYQNFSILYVCAFINEFQRPTKQNILFVIACKMGTSIVMLTLQILLSFSSHLNGIFLCKMAQEMTKPDLLGIRLHNLMS